MSTGNYERLKKPCRSVSRLLVTGGLLIAFSTAATAQAANLAADVHGDGILNAPYTDDPFASALMAGDINGDGYDDLALGVAPMHTETTILLKKSFDDLVVEADAIVVGTVTEIESLYGTGKDIYTLVTLTDLEILHGRLDDTNLTLRLLGGQIGGEFLEVAGSPKLARDERVLLFVHGNGREFVPIVGWTQGVFRLELDSATGKVKVKDHERNPVLEVRGREVVRHQLRRPETAIVPDLTRPQRPNGSAGVSDDDDARPGPQVSAEPPPADAMDADAFLQAVARTIKEKGAVGKRIESAYVERVKDDPAEHDAPPPLR
jgi:hypothetical protein